MSALLSKRSVRIIEREVSRPRTRGGRAIDDETASIVQRCARGLRCMMVGLLGKNEAIADLALELWAFVLIELNIRGRVQLVRGTYGDIGRTEIKRLYAVGC